MQPRQLLQIDNFSDFMQSLFPQRDLVGSEQDQVTVRKKLSTDPAVAFQRRLLEIRAQSCLKQGQL